MAEISCAPNDLMADARCIESCVPPGMQMPILISLFCTLADMDCTPAALMTSAVCQLQCIPPGMQMPVLISLACQIVNGGGGGSGAQQVYSFAGDPNGNVTPTTILPCVCIDTNTGVLYQKTDGLLTNTNWV